MARQETIQRKKDYAKLLFTIEGVTSGKELAERVGVSEQTISKWKKTENWEGLRASVLVTKESELRRIYAQITELNDAIAGREKGTRYANSKEGDTLSKLTGAVRQLETETSAAEAMEVMKNFINFIRVDDYEKAKEITLLADGFIKTLVK